MIFLVDVWCFVQTQTTNRHSNGLVFHCVQLVFWDIILHSLNVLWLSLDREFQGCVLFPVQPCRWVSEKSVFIQIEQMDEKRNNRFLSVSQPPFILFFFLSRHTLAWMFPHAHTDRWQQSSVGFSMCVFSLLFCSSAAFYTYTHTHTHNPHSLHRFSLPLSVYTFLCSGTSSASKLGYSMPLPNCPTAWGSVCSC